MNQNISIPIPTEDTGFLGRECPKCKKYFKLKPGTGLPIKHCHCPYCDNYGEQDIFTTPEQIIYAKSIVKKIAYENIVEPLLNDLSESFKDLERATKGGFIQIKVTEKRDVFFPINYYREKELETIVECDSCGLHFSVYGVFANCPDCSKLNAFIVFRNSIEISIKQLALFAKNEIPTDLFEINLKFILTNAISAFDGIGKEIKKRFENKFPEKPKNLFQNLFELNKVFESNFGVKLSNRHDNYNFIYKMFQVRHIYEHNMGVVDAECIMKVPELQPLLGRKYQLQKDEIEIFLTQISKLVEIIKDVLTTNSEIPYS